MNYEQFYVEFIRSDWILIVYLNIALEKTLSINSRDVRDQLFLVPVPVLVLVKFNFLVLVPATGTESGPALL